MSRATLYKTLSDPTRLALIALVSEHELQISEIASILTISQSQASKRTKELFERGLLHSERRGNSTWVSLKTQTLNDVVVRDALNEGRRLCILHQHFERLHSTLALRDQENGAPTQSPVDLPLLGAHLRPFQEILGRPELAIDVGCGEGLATRILATLYQNVIAIDLNADQIRRCSQRMLNLGLDNVETYNLKLSDISVKEQIHKHGGADLIYLSRVLHHVTKPEELLRQVYQYLKPGGRIMVIDYVEHKNESMRSKGDLWLGFDEKAILGMLKHQGFESIASEEIPSTECGFDEDANLKWNYFVAHKV